MYEELQKTIRELGDRKAGWVTRRDAAEVLGNLARQSLAALDAHRADNDVDVRMAVARALGNINSPPPSELTDRTYSLKELVDGCAKPGSRTVEPHGKGYAIRVNIDDARGQAVYVMPHKRRDGTSLVRVYSYCGKPTDEVLNWAMRSNAKLVHCAFAVEPNGEKDQVVLVNNFVHGKATPAMVKASVKEIAFYADWLEKKLTGLDEL